MSSIQHRVEALERLQPSGVQFVLVSWAGDTSRMSATIGGKLIERGEAEPEEAFHDRVLAAARKDAPCLPGPRFIFVNTGVPRADDDN